jgi:glucose/mannose transport system substrate-binding protein
MRRALIFALALALPFIAVACEEDEEGGPAEGGEVEVFSWWTAGGEAEALEALVQVFGEEYPDYEFVNAAVAGGAGTEARAVLATRLSAEDPPASWQGHAGQELIGTYVAAGQLEPLNDLFEEQGWLDVMPQDLIDLISEDGDIYSVPVNIHRANMLWYNPTVLEDNGVEVPATWDEFFATAETLQAAGVTPLALGDAEGFATKHLFETILLGTMGPERYNGLWDGSTDWSGPEVTEAIDTLARALGYVNSDYTALTWSEATQLVIDGDAAFNVMGDWAEGYFKAQGVEPTTGFGWAPSPGTDGVFQMLSDSFVLPEGSPNREGTLAWLTVAGSKAGQDAFNPVKGSIPARTDADRSLYDEYLQYSLDCWASDTIVGSLTHGAAANDAWNTEITTALGLFLADEDQAAFQDALVAACETAGACA